MNFDLFKNTNVKHEHNTQALTNEPCPQICKDILSKEMCDEAEDLIKSWSGYEATPLLSLDELADELNLSKIYYKDEATRFGLGSFKALGGAYAVLRVLMDTLAEGNGPAVSVQKINSGACKDQVKDITVITATDGNHGRSVAWGAAKFGCQCKIYMHSGVSKGRAEVVEKLGAEVVWVEGNYDDSVRQAAHDAEKHNWLIVSDTSYEGYTEIAKHVMAGYSVMTSEICDQLSDEKPPTHIFIQAGCGGLASAVSAHLWQVYEEKRPNLIIVEPFQAACLYESGVEGGPVEVDIQSESIMAGLSCGEISLVGWDILKRGTEDFLVIDDELIAPIMKLLASGLKDHKIVAGESAVAGLSGLIAACEKEGLAEKLGLDENSRVLILGTEGATDPAIYKELVGLSPEEVI